MNRVVLLALLLSACAETPDEVAVTDARVVDHGGAGGAIVDSEVDQSWADAAPDSALDQDADLDEDAAPDAAPEDAAVEDDAHMDARVDAMIVDAAQPDAAPDMGPALLVSMLPEPGLLNPRMHFHTGGVVNAAPEIFPNTPNMPGYPDSPWFIAQWAKTFPGEAEGTGLMRPDVMFENAPSTEDPVLGVARWAFPGGQDNRSHLWVYLHGDRPVYELYSEHGWLSPAGGSNVFLSSAPQPGVNHTMDRPVTLRFNTKLRSQVAHYTDDDAARDGAVLWQYFSGLIFQYPGESGPITLFMQIRHGQSRGGDRYLFAPTDTELVYGYNFPDEPQLLQAAAPNAPLVARSINVNRYLCDAIRGAYPRAAGGRLNLPPDALNPERWQFNSFYIGLETQSGRLEDGHYRGAAAAQVQIADLRLERDESRPSPGCP